MANDLILHKGARLVTLEQLAAVETPPATGTWFPVPHAKVIETVTNRLADVGLVVDRAQYGLSPRGHRMFATLDLKMELADGIKLAAGIRSSTDQSFPLGFVGGHRVFVCDNLGFSAELAVQRKHTRHGHDRFNEDVVRSVGQLEAFRQAETIRIERMKEMPVTDTVAESFMLRAFEKNLCGPLHLPKLIKEWRNPTHPGDMSQKTAWSLFNAFTLIMKERAVRNPQRYANATMDIQAMLAAYASN